MFTGIVAEVGKVVSITPEHLKVNAPGLMDGVELGASIAVNGTCLTVTSFNSDSFAVGLSPETLNRTNLGSLKIGDPVNLERALKFGGELGGHLVQGHIDGTGKVISIVSQNGANIFTFSASPEIMHYLVEKGFIAIEGISLTIMGLNESSFQVSVIDFTRAHTNLIYRKPGDTVNLEIDIMAKYAEKFIQTQKPTLNMDFLAQNGF